MTTTWSAVRRGDPPAVTPAATAEMLKAALRWAVECLDEATAERPSENPLYDAHLATAKQLLEAPAESWMATVHTPNNDGAPVLFGSEPEAAAFALLIEERDSDAVVDYERVPVYALARDAVDAWFSEGGE